MSQRDERDPFQEDLPSELRGFEVSAEDLALFAGAEDEPVMTEAIGKDMARTAFSEHTVPDLELSEDKEDEFTGSLRAIRDHLDLPEHPSVIYPGSSTHIGVARVFGKENVIHVDPDERATNTLSNHDYRVAVQGISDYEPAKPSDLMVALNSYGELGEDDVDRLIKGGGYLITNNYTNWAGDGMRLKNLSLVGAFLPSYFEGSYVESDDIPQDATDMHTTYYYFPPEGGMKVTTADQPGAFPDESARYPDGLFVFKKK